MSTSAIKSGKSTVDKYNKRIIDYKTAKKELGNLLRKAVKSKDGSVAELIQLGAPITIDNGLVFAEAIKLWHADLLHLVSAERITNFMRDKTRARNLIASTIPYHTLEAIITKDKRNNKHDSYAYKNILIMESGVLGNLIMSRIKFPLSKLEEIVDKKLENHTLMYYDSILEEVLKQNPNYIKQRLDGLIEHQDKIRNIYDLMMILYKLHEDAKYQYYAEQLDEDSLKYFLEYDNNFELYMFPIIQSYIELDKVAAYKEIKKVMNNWNNVVQFLNYVDSYGDYNLYNDVFAMIISDERFNNQIIRDYLGMASWKLNLNKESGKILQTITTAAIVGNENLIDAIVAFFADRDDVEMLKKINEARIIGG